MQVENTREALRLFERASTEHVTWLMQVHAALMFPDAPDVPPCAPDAPLSLLAACACGHADELAPLLRLRAAMRGRADQLLDTLRCRRPIQPEEYQAFMAAVDAYSREARRVESHFRRVLLETDPLTGIHNRQGMNRDLCREWTRAMRTGQPLCIAMADLDHFKHVNDRWGHVTGDRVLCAASSLFQRRLRPYDSVYRFGGEEFLFCLPNTDAATAGRILDRLRRVLAKMTVTSDDGQPVPVTVSIGVAQMGPGRTVQDAVAAADRALYMAKETGRNRVELAPDEPAARVPEILAAHLRGVRGTVRHY